VRYRPILFQLSPNGLRSSTQDCSSSSSNFFGVDLQMAGLRQQARDQRTPVVKQKRCAERVLSRHLAAVPLPETEVTNSQQLTVSLIIRRFIQTWLDQAHLLWMDWDPFAVVCFPNYLALFFQTGGTVLYLNYYQCLFLQRLVVLSGRHFAFCLWLIIVTHVLRHHRRFVTEIL
jgi:hypothetical protein